MPTVSTLSQHCSGNTSWNGMTRDRNTMNRNMKKSQTVFRDDTIWTILEIKNSSRNILTIINKQQWDSIHDQLIQNKRFFCTPATSREKNRRHTLIHTSLKGNKISTSEPNQMTNLYNENFKLLKRLRNTLEN